MRNVKLLVKFELIIATAIAIATLAGKSNLVSLCFYTSFLVMMVLVLKLSRYRSQCKTVAVVTIIFAFGSVVISAFSCGELPPLSNMIFFLVFSALLMYLYLLQIIDIDYALFNWIMKWGIVFSSCFPIAYYIFNIRTNQAGYLSMNYSNSNLLGMWILQATLFAFLNLFWQKGLIKKGICIILCITNIKLLLLSGTRNALLALVVGGVIILLHLYRKCKYSKGLLFGVAVLPILFLIMYLSAFSVLSENKFFLQFAMEGKGIDSRYEMWTATLYNLKGKLLTGSYCSLAGNVHNSHLVILASYGVIVLILTIIFLYKVMRNVNNQCDSFFQKMCLAAFFVTIFMGIGEGALFSGAVGLYIPSCIYLLLCRYNPEHG